MEIVLVQIKNGWLIVNGRDTLYVKDAAELHRELEYLVNVLDPLPEAPKPPTEKPKASGVRQFDDED